MYICITEVDAVTKIVCTAEPQRTGPSMPAIKGWTHIWHDSSTWPVEVASDGTYLRAPRYYGTCDDDADTSISGVLQVLTEAEYTTILVNLRLFINPLKFTLGCPKYDPIHVLLNATVPLVV